MKENYCNTYVFIDESGINKKIDYSCFAFVFIKQSDYKFIEKSISELEKKLNIENFHWSEDNWNVKKNLLKEILNKNINLKIKILINPINQGKELIGCFLDFMKDNRNYYVFIDGKKSKKYENKIKKYLKDNNIPIKKIRTIKDNNSVGIKIADYTAGFFRYYFDNQSHVNLDLINLFNKMLKYKVIELKKPQ